MQSSKADRFNRLGPPGTLRNTTDKKLLLSSSKQQDWDQKVTIDVQSQFQEKHDQGQNLNMKVQDQYHEPKSQRKNRHHFQDQALVLQSSSKQRRQTIRDFDQFISFISTNEDIKNPLSPDAQDHSHIKDLDYNNLSFQTGCQAISPCDQQQCIQGSSSTNGNNCQQQYFFNQRVYNQYRKLQKPKNVNLKQIWGGLRFSQGGYEGFTSFEDSKTSLLSVNATNNINPNPMLTHQTMSITPQKVIAQQQASKTRVAEVPNNLEYIKQKLSNKIASAEMSFLEKENRFMQKGQSLMTDASCELNSNESQHGTTTSQINQKMNNNNQTQVSNRSRRYQVQHNVTHNKSIQNVPNNAQIDLTNVDCQLRTFHQKQSSSKRSAVRLPKSSSGVDQQNKVYVSNFKNGSGHCPSTSGISHRIKKATHQTQQHSQNANKGNIHFSALPALELCTTMKFVQQKVS